MNSIQSGNVLISLDYMTLIEVKRGKTEENPSIITYARDEFAVLTFMDLIKKEVQQINRI